MSSSNASIKQQTRSQLECWKLRLKNGRGKPRGRLEVETNKTNRLRTIHTHWALLIPELLLRNFCRLGNVFFLMVFLIMLIKASLSPYLIWIIVFPNLFYSLIFVIKELYIIGIRRSPIIAINNRVSFKGEKELKWQDMRPGDIIDLKNEDICPADILILNSTASRGQGKIAWVDTQGVDGFTAYNMKRAIQATRTLTSIRELSGTLTYDPPSDDLNFFKGSLKVEGSFYQEFLSIDNVILRGSVLKNTDEVQGLVLYTGEDTKLMRNTSKNIGKSSAFESLVERFFCVGLFLVFIMTVVSTIALLIEKDKYELHLEDPSINFVRIFYFFVLYAPFLPISLYGVYDLVVLIRRVSVQRDMNKTNKDSVKVMDPNTLPVLGQVDYCLLDKTGTLTTSQYKIKSIFIFNKRDYADSEPVSYRMYRIDEKVINEEFPNYSQNRAKRLETIAPGMVNIGLEGGEQHDEHTALKATSVEKKSLVDLTPAKEKEKAPASIGSLNTLGTIKAKPKENPPAISDDFLESVPEEGPKVEGNFLNELKRSTMKNGMLPTINTEGERRVETENEPLLLTDNQITSPNQKSGEKKSLLTSLPGTKDGEGAQKKKVGFGAFEKTSTTGGMGLSTGKTFGEMKTTVFDPNEVLGNKDFLEDFCRSKDKSQPLQALILNLALCHTASTNTKQQYQTPYPVEYSMLNFAKTCKKQFIRADKYEDPSEYLLKEDDVDMKFKILGLNDFSYIRKRSSVIYETGGRAVICAKGPAESMRQALTMSPEEWKVYDQVVTNLQKEGLRIQVIGKKDLDADETKDFEKQYSNLKNNIVQQTKELEELATKYEKGMALMGIVALQDELRDHAVETVDMLRDANINIFMVSGDNRENCVNVAYNTGILKKGMTVRHLKIDNELGSRAAIKSLLDGIQNQIQEEKAAAEAPPEDKKDEKKEEIPVMYGNRVKYALVLDGDTFDYILKDVYVEANFAYAASLSYTLIAYRFSPDQKAALARIMKKRFANEPILLAIGDGLNDTKMMHAVDVSIEVHNECILPSANGDIKVANLSSLKKLLLVHGRVITEKVEGLILYLFYASTFLGFPIFLYGFYCKFSGTAIYDSMLIFMFTFWFTFFSVLAYASFDGFQLQTVLLKYPALYMDGRTRRIKKWTLFAIRGVGQGLGHAIILFFTTLYTVQYAASKNGETSDTGMVSLVQFYAIVIICNIKLWWNYRKTLVSFIILIIFSLGSLSAYIVIHTKAGFTDTNFENETYQIFHWAGSILSLFWPVIFISALNYLMAHYIEPWVVESLFRWGAINNAGTDKTFTNAKILEHAATPMYYNDFAEEALYCFREHNTMDTVVAKIISPYDEEELKLNKFTLQFNGKDTGAEHRYSIQITRNVINYTRIIYPILWFVFGFYILGCGIILQNSVWTFSRVGILLGFFGFGIFLYTDFYRQNYYRVSAFFVFWIVAFKIIIDYTRVADDSYMTALLPILIVTIFNVKFFNIAILLFIHYVFSEVRLNMQYANNSELGYLPNNDDMFYVNWSYVVLILAIHVIMVALNYKFEKQRRAAHHASSKLMVQQATSGEMLSLLLPEFVRDKYEQFMGGKTYKELQEEPVAMLFCYILDFAQILVQEGPGVVQILDEIFKEFDKLCRQHGVQKIETVDSSYVACAGLNAAEVNLPKNLSSNPPVRRLLNMSLDMVQFVSTKKVAEKPLKIWVGLHYGKCAAGVIGCYKPQFSLIGDTVNTTSRVCILKCEKKPPNFEDIKQADIRLSNEAYESLQAVGGAGRKGLRFDAFPGVEFKGKPPTTIWTCRKETTSTKAAAAKPKGLKGGLLGKLQNAVATVIQQNDAKKVKKVLRIKDLIEFAQQEKEKIQNMYERNREADKKGDDDDYEEEEEVNIIANMPFLTLDSYSWSKRIRYELDNFRHCGILYRTEFLILFYAHLLQTLFTLTIMNSFQDWTAIFILRLCFLPMILVLWLGREKLLYKHCLKPIQVIFILYGIIISLIQARYSPSLPDVYERIQLIEACLIYIVGTHTNNIDFINSVFIFLGMVVEFFAIWGVTNILNIDNVFFFALFSIGNLVHVYVYQLQEIEVYNILKAADKRDSKQEFLVSQLLPTHARVKYFSDPDRSKEIVDKFDDVTMIYTDIKGFTEFANGRNPGDVVDALATLYNRFDQLVFEINKTCKPDEPKLYKVYTIGDAYIVLSFVDDQKRDKLKEVYNSVKMAFNMRSAIEEVKKLINFNGLQIRIGLHTGSIIGGVVGTDIVRYDIYGVDTKIANEMESECQEGRINVSEDTKKIMEDDPNCPYRFEENRVVDLHKFHIKKPCFYIEPLQFMEIKN